MTGAKFGLTGTQSGHGLTFGNRSTLSALTPVLPTGRPFPPPGNQD